MVGTTPTARVQLMPSFPAQSVSSPTGIVARVATAVVSTARQAFPIPVLCSSTIAMHVCGASSLPPTLSPSRNLPAMRGQHLSILRRSVVAPISGSRSFQSPCALCPAAFRDLACNSLPVDSFDPDFCKCNRDSHRGHFLSTKSWKRYPHTPLRNLCL